MSDPTATRKKAADLVIDIDGIRTVAPPEKDPFQQELEGTLDIGPGEALPFTLEEDDPIFHDALSGDRDDHEKDDGNNSVLEDDNESSGRYEDADSYIDSSDDERIIQESKRKKAMQEQQQQQLTKPTTTTATFQIETSNKPQGSPLTARDSIVEKIVPKTDRNENSKTTTRTTERKSQESIPWVQVVPEVFTQSPRTSGVESLGGSQAVDKDAEASSMEISASSQPTDEETSESGDELPVEDQVDPSSREGHVDKTGHGSPPNTPSLEDEEEALLMGRLDDDITAQEEKALLKHLDDDITAHEERYLLSKLRQEIALSAAKEQFLKERSSHVDYVLAPTDDIPGDEPWTDEAWTDEVPLGDSMAFSLHDSTTVEPLIAERCEGRFRATGLIPKFLVSRSQPFITRKSFQENVVGYVRRMLQPQPLDLWSLRLQLLDVEEDPDSYRVVVTGHKVAVDMVKVVITNWVISKITRRNMRVVVSDPAGITLDLKLNCREKLGAAVHVEPGGSLKSWRENEQLELDGIWIKTIHEGGMLARALGSSVQNGATMMAVDGKRCRVAEEFIEFVSEAKAREQETMIVTVALSRYADLSHLDLSKVQNYNNDTGICRRDGQPYSRLEMGSWTVPVPIPPARRGGKPTDKEIKEAPELCRAILTDERSVEVDLIVSAAEALGGNVQSVETDGDEKAMFIMSFKENSQLEKILGKKACIEGAALVQAGGQHVSTAKELKNIALSAGLHGGTYRIRICFRDGVDLSGVDLSKLVTGRTNPRRRNGTLYPPWTWIPPPPPSTTRPPNAKPISKQKETTGKGRDKQDKGQGKARKNDSKKRAADESTTESSRPLKKAARTTSLEAGTSEQQNNAQHGVESYTSFKNKFKTLRITEYKDIGINSLKANSSMWKQHKMLFGENAMCDDNCPCLFKLKEMTQHVVRDFKKAEMTKDPKKEMDIGNTVGFSKHFVPRFAPLLRKEYPKENTAKLLERLYSMWDAHRKNRNFGLTCRKECDCEEGWEIVFGKGDPSSVMNTRRSKKTNSSGSGPGTKKQKLAPDPSARSSASESRVLPLKTAMSMTSGATRKSYEVTFDSKIPLGAFFVTERKSTGSQCKIHSVWGRGQIKNDKRIHRGTIVESVFVGHGKVDVESHSELKQLYDDARQVGSTLRLKLINTDVASNVTSGMAETERDWTSSGNWQGRSIVGWPGGAAMRSTVEAKAKPRTETTAISTVESAIEAKEDGWTTVKSTVTSSHRHSRPSKSALKGNDSNQRREKVRFTPQFEERTYLKDSFADEIRVKSSQVQDQLAAVPHESLIDVIQHKMCDDVIRVLEEGSSEDSTDPDALKVQYNSIENAIVEIRRYRELDRLNESLRIKEMDLVHKKTALNIFLNCALMISKAFSLKAWKSFHINLRHISLRLAPTPRVPGRTNVLTGRVKSKIDDAYGEVGALIPKPLVEHMIYTEDDQQNTFKVQNNYQLLHEKRDLVVFLEEGLPTDSVLPRKLGSFTIPMNRLHEACPDNGSWETITTTVTSSNLIERGEIAIEVKKARVPPEYIRSKQDEITVKLGIQLENIARFNEEREKLGLRKLTGNIRGPDKTSLLHAVIELQQVGFVSKLIQLGASPTLKGPAGKGSPLAYAQNLLDRTKEKMLRAEHEQKSTDQYKDVNGNYESMVQRLRGAGSSSEDQRPQGKSAQGQALRAGAEPTPLSTGDVVRKNIEEQNAGSVTTLTRPSSEAMGTLQHQTAMSQQATHSSPTATVSQIELSILKKLLRSAKTSEGGTQDGTQAKKCVIGGNLRTKYPKLFPDKQALNDFWKRLLSSGNAIETGSNNLLMIRLCSPNSQATAWHNPIQEQRISYPSDPNASQAAGHAVATGNYSSVGHSLGQASDKPLGYRMGHEAYQHENLPTLPSSDWYLRGVKKRCFRFNKPEGCRYGSRCNYVHVKKPLEGIPDDNILFFQASPITLNPQTLEIKSMEGWYTAAYHDMDENVVYYAERGPTSRMSRQCIFWYPSRQEAEEAIRRQVFVSKQRSRSWH